jgi:hypothetical protein
MEGSASQAGFYYQNNIAALKVIECLFFNSDIRQIRLENYDKGNHIDDIIIYRQDKIDYYQVKWSEDGDNSYSLYNLLKSEVNNDGKVTKKSLFKQLAEGYLSAKLNSDNFSITLFTTKRESNQKRPSEGINHSLSEIRTNIFEPLKHSDISYDKLPNYTEYKETIEKIRQDCSLDEEEFDQFIKNLEFKFSQDPTEQIQQALKFKLETLGIETSLLEKLVNGVVKWSISGESITKDVVLKELGVTDRFEDKLSHYFKVIDEEHYVPNHFFFDQLEKGLTELQGGYIFIEGLPGIGKSTALTKFKEQNRNTTLAYYCFIPDVRNDFGELRHQSYYFLKSLCITIEKNFPEVDLPSRYSEQYEEKLHSYIEALSRLKRKIIFIVDGLDHVHRDTTLGEKSLLNNIKGNLPENIYFILSSQYEAVLSPSVKNQIDADPRRHIKVSPFSQSEVKQYLENKSINTNNTLDKIERISGGIPIYLHYISELLIKVDEREYEKVLQDLPNLVNGKINSYHEYLFQKIENDTFSKWVLAVLAYRKENTSIEVIQKILALIGEIKNLIEIEEVVNGFTHLLRQIDGRSYSIFHNSFREFILSKTEDLKDTFNKALVAFYEQSPFTDEAYRNYFSHLYELTEYRKLISLTTLEWMKIAWRNYRTLEEIKENLSIALKATIEETSLSEFIRIAFLKTQLDRASWNLENSEIDFPTLLLNAGETANSLRNVWDGDFVLTSKEYFCYYVGEYYKKTRILLPHNIIKQGLSKALKKQDSDGITQVLKAEALVVDDIVSLFKEIDDIKWQTSNEHDRSYLKKSHTEDENVQINLKIKSKIIDYLVKCKQYHKLFQLLKAYKEEQKLFPKVKIALIELLLRMPTEKAAAIKMIKEIDFSDVSDKMYFKLITYCSDYLTDEEIREVFPNKPITEPELFEKVVDKEGMSYVLRKEIINLYNDLKPIWIFHPDLVQTLTLKVSYLSSPAEDIYNSIFTLSDLWHKNRTSNLNESEIISQLKESIESLYIKREQEFRTRAHGLFDMDTDSTFIASSIKHLFKNIFRLSTRLLSEEKLETLVDYWIDLDKSGDGFRHYSVGLVIANEIYNSRYKDLAQLIHKIITHAEKTARLEQDTVTLTSYLGEVVETYGMCGFREDFQKIYNQLIEISFGVGYRKDYQASNIIEPMELIHKVDPDNTLKRLSEVFHIQDKLNDAGNGRMRHICLSNLIAFTANKYPELAFRLMELEEPHIARDEAIDIIIDPLIENCENDDLELYLAIIKTLPRWENGGTSEAHFISLTKTLLVRAIYFNNQEVIKAVLNIVKFNALVELEDEKTLSKFSEIFRERGIDYNDYSLPNPDIVNNEKETNILPNQQNSPKEKFVTNNQKLQFNELVDLFDNNYKAFEKYIQSQLNIYTQNRRNQLLRKEYYSAKSLFENFYKETPSENKLIIEEKRHRVIREFICLKNKIAHFNAEAPLKLKNFETLFSEFIEKIDKLLSNNAFTVYVHEKLDVEQWFENIQRELNWNGDHFFSLILSDKEVIQLIEQSSIMDLEKLLDFVEKWTRHKTRSASLLKIANRLITIDLNKAKEVISLATSQYEFDSVLFQRENDPDKLDFDIFKTILEADKEFGKKILLNGYYAQKGNYNGELTNSLDKLLKYQAYFDDGAVKAYYDANLLYNRELASGLPDKENRYEFISEHIERYTFSEVVIKHLVWLFNYPAVKIRELALQSVFDLIKENSNYIRSFIHFGIENGNDNEIEYSLVVLQAIALKNPIQLVTFKMELMNLLKWEHFNTLEATKELLLLISKSTNSFLSKKEVAKTKSLNSPTKLFVLFSKLPKWCLRIVLNLYNLESRNEIVNKSYLGTDFIYSSFQYGLMSEINENEKDNSIFDSAYWDIVSKGWADYDMEKEGAVHQRYNINTNFDTIEIQSPYYDAVKSSLNKIFHLKIKRNCFEASFVEKIKREFRIYDPSKLLYPVVSRPSYINWIPEKISKDYFLAFSDFESLTKEFIHREEEYITLVEYGSQRTHRYKELSGTCYFEIKAFLKTKDFDLTKLDPMPFIQLENQYAYELPLVGYFTSSFPLKGVKPLVQISYNAFRGEQNLASANLFTDTFGDLNIKEKNLLEIFTAQEDYPLKAISWINSYTSGPSWRRYKPSSEGFTFRIEKHILLDFLKKNDLVLCYNIRLKRSADEYRPENRMRWHKLDRNFMANL